MAVNVDGWLTRDDVGLAMAHLATRHADSQRIAATACLATAIQ